MYEVHQGTTKLGGVPFYRLAGSCTQETVYLETIYHLAIQVPKQGETAPIVLMQKSIPESVYLSAEMQQVRDAVAATTPSLNTIKTRFNGLPAYTPTATPERVLVANTAKADTYVDYGSVHYLNVSRPGIGSAAATAKLNPNGTLSEGAAEVEDKTAEVILGAFPIKEAVLGILSGAGLSMMIEGADDKTPRPVQLVVTALPFKHTYSRTESANPPCTVLTALPRTDENGKDLPASFRREPVAGASGEKDDNAIGFTGKIVLPKKGGGE